MRFLRVGFTVIFSSFLVLQANTDTSRLIKSKNFKAFNNHLQNIKNSMDSMEIEEVSFPVQKEANSDVFFERKGFLVKRPLAVGTVIVGHGYTQSKHDVLFFRTLFPYFNVLVFDFRAHGELIDGQYSTIGRDEIFDVKGAVDFVRSDDTLGSKFLVGFGLSMGAVSILQAQAYFNDLFDVLILDSPFDSSSACMAKGIEQMLKVKILGKEFQLPGKRLIMKSLYSPRLQTISKRLFKWVSGLNVNVARTKFVPVIPLNLAPKITVPCLFISCENDKKVSVDCVQRLYEAVQSPYKRLWITHGIKHCGSCLAQPELYTYRINNFIRKIMSGEYLQYQAAKVHDERVSISAL